MALFNDVSSAQVQRRSFDLLLKTILSGSVPKIAVPDAAKKASGYLFLDAREPEEYNVSHIPNARFVGYKSFHLSQLKGVEKNRPIVVYCSIGKRSDDITKRLMDAGFTQVQNLYGGIFEWVNQGNTVVDMQHRKTDRVHAYNRFWGQWLEQGKKVY